MLKPEQKRDICEKLSWEGGLEYLLGGSSFPEIKDKRFRTLLKAFKKSHAAIARYTGFDVYDEDEGVN